MTIITIVISKASHAIDTRWHFLRLLTALHVNNNNIFITFQPLPNIFLYFSSTEDYFWYKLLQLLTLERGNCEQFLESMV